jgi:hypothetical protein
MPVIDRIVVEGGKLTHAPLTAEALGRIVAAAAGVPEVIAEVPAQRVIPVHNRLLKALAAAGIERCETGNQLSPAQLDTLLAGRAPDDRIALKMLAEAAGIMPP